MWDEILQFAVNNGIWATLFVGLMVHILKDTAKREKKYQEMETANQQTIKSLSESLRVVNEISIMTKELNKELKEHRIKSED